MKKFRIGFYLSLLTFASCVSAWAQTPPQYVLVKTGTPSHFANGDTITYQLIAFNNTNTSQPNFTIVDNVPNAFVVNSATGQTPLPSAIPVSPALPMTGPTPLTIGPFAIAANSSVTVTLTMVVNVSASGGLVQTVTNSALLYLNGGSVSNSKANGSACAGTNVTMQFNGANGQPVQGNAMFFPNRQYNAGIIVGDNGAINLFNGVTMVPQNSPTSNELLGVDGCVDAQGNTQEVVVGKNGTLLMNENNEGFKILNGEPYANNASDPYEDYSHFSLYYNGQPLQEYIGPNSLDPDSGVPPCSTVSAVAGPKLNLQVLCYETPSQERRWKIRIINEGTTPVALTSAFSVVAWFNQSGAVAGQWQGNMNIHDPDGTQIGAYNPGSSNVAVAATPYGPCVIGGTQVANQQLSLSLGAFNGDVIPPNGGYVDEIQFQASRCLVPPSPACGTWDDPDTSYTQCPAEQEVDFTSVKVVGCNQAYITTNTGEVLYCSDLSNSYANGDGSCFRVIKGGSVCPSDSTSLNTVEVVDNKWLLIGGQNGLFEISNFPQSTNSTCANFASVQFSDGTVPIGSINDIEQIDSGQIFAVGSNGQVFYSPDNTEPGQPIFVNENLGIPTTRTLTSVDGTDLSHVVFTGPNHVYQFDGTGTQSLTVENNGMTDNTAVQFVIGPDGQVDGEFVLCTGVLTFECLTTGSIFQVPTPPTTTPTPTFTLTPGLFTPGSGTPGFGTITPTPTWTVTSTPQGGGGSGTSGTQTPGFGTPIPTATPTPTPFGGGGGGTGGGTETPGFGTPIPTDTPTPTPQFGTPESTVTSVLTQTSGSGTPNGETPTPTPLFPPGTPTVETTSVVTPGPTVVTTPPVVDYHAAACLSADDGTFITLVAGDDGTLVKRIQSPSGLIQEVIPVFVNGVKITADFYSIFACNSQEWWLAGTDGTLVVTQDAGTTWTQVDLGTSASGVLLTSVTADITCTNIQVTGQNGSFYKFTYGGTSTPVVSGGGPGSFIPGTAAQCPVPYAAPVLSDFTGSGVHFDKTFEYPSTGEEWIVGQDSEGHGFILHSSGGTSPVFCRSVLPLVGTDAGPGAQVTEITDIFENAPTDIWAVGSRAQDANGNGFNVILHSSDDGATWQSFPQLETIPGILNGTSATGVNVVGNTIRVSTTIGDVIQITVDETASGGLTGALAEPGAVSFMSVGGTLTAVCACITCGLDGVIKPISDCSPFGVGFTPTNTPTATSTPCQACAGVSISIGVPFYSTQTDSPLSPSDVSNPPEVNPDSASVTEPISGVVCLTVPVTLSAPPGCANYQYCLRSHPTGVPAGYTDMGSVVGNSSPFITTVQACVNAGAGSFQVDVYPCGSLEGTACATSNSEAIPPTPTPTATGTSTGTATSTPTITETATPTITPTSTCVCNGFRVGSGINVDLGSGSSISGQLAGPVVGSFTPVAISPPPDPWVNPIGNSEWVGLNYSAADNGSVPQTYVYSQTFTVPALNVNYQISLLVDDEAAVSINGNLLTQGCSSFQSPCVIQIPSADLISGTNTLSVIVVDTQATKTGVDYEITCSCPKPPTATPTPSPTFTPTETATPTFNPNLPTICGDFKVDGGDGNDIATTNFTAAIVSNPPEGPPANAYWGQPIGTSHFIGCNVNGASCFPVPAEYLFQRQFTISNLAAAYQIAYKGDDFVSVAINGHVVPNGCGSATVPCTFSIPVSWLNLGTNTLIVDLSDNHFGSTGADYEITCMCDSLGCVLTDTPTITQTPTVSPTLTVTTTSTGTPSPTPSVTFTATSTVTDTPTFTVTSTETSTPTPSPSFTATVTYTDTPTPSSTVTTALTATWTPSSTETSTPTDTPTVTPIFTETDTLTVTSTATLTPTWTWTSSPTVTLTATATFTSSFTPTATPTPSTTATWTQSPTASWTKTETSTATPTPTSSWTSTPSPTSTSTWTPTFTITPTLSPTPLPEACNQCSGIGISCANLRANSNPNPGCAGEDVLADLTFSHPGDSFGAGCTCVSFLVRLYQQSNQNSDFVTVGTETYCLSQGAQFTQTVDFCVPASWEGTAVNFQLYTNGICGNSNGCEIPTGEIHDSALSGEVPETPTFIPDVSMSSRGVVAAPNISRNGEPIQFGITLKHPARVHLALYTVTGERIYDALVSGNQGLNVLTWDTDNNTHQAVASGLYIYLLEVEGSDGSWRKIGKVIVLR